MSMNAVYYLIFILCGGVIGGGWFPMEGVLVAALGGIREALEEDGQKRGVSKMGYSWFLEYQGGNSTDGGSGGNIRSMNSLNSQLSNVERGVSGLNVTQGQGQLEDFIYLDSVGIWVRFHDYASNVGFVRGFSRMESTPFNSTRAQSGGLGEQNKGGPDGCDSYGAAFSKSLRRSHQRREPSSSLFQVISQDWLLGWGFICDYFREFILN
ncbi:putative signal peptide-containing membrane protein [Cryptosporidium canis]|uniref:Signal peptide-containing membrane protein n=1 Tax=Cryptosporidium canis TaxID=195482 RepID=A0ABQ8P4X0_9CRYT|nr:putative signal peptide-containing membrane protein [Cryptosporidium canis]